MIKSKSEGWEALWQISYPGDVALSSLCDVKMRHASLIVTSLKCHDFRSKRLGFCKHIEWPFVRLSVS